jgi:hypothetical protein
LPEEIARDLIGSSFFAAIEVDVDAGVLYPPTCEVAGLFEVEVGGWYVVLALRNSLFVAGVVEVV